MYIDIKKAYNDISNKKNSKNILFIHTSKRFKIRFKITKV